jgi:agmatinase
MTVGILGDFLGNASVGRDVADALILPLPFEKTVSYGSGTSGGPRAIIQSSPQLELFDDETLVDFTQGPKVHTLAAVEYDCNESVENYLEKVRACVASHRGKFVLSLGGEHTLTYGLVKGTIDDLSKMTVVQIDAHCDLADKLGGLHWSHGTVMRRLWEEGCRFMQIGIRSLSRPEYELVASGERIKTFFAHSLVEQWQEVLQTLRDLEGPVYFTFDVDGLDPSIIPSTGTPQPEGLNWRQAMTVIREIAFSRKIQWLGADVVEYVPSPFPPGSDPTAAKLVAKILAWRYLGQKERCARNF